MDACWCQEAFMFFPMVESGRLVSLQVMGGLSGDDLGVIAVEFPIQRRSQQRANLWDSDRWRGFLPPGFLCEEPGGQQRQCLMMMPTPPRPNFVIDEEIPIEWFCSGCKNDVPKCAAFAGSFHGQHCWVLPAQVGDLSGFTLAITEPDQGQRRSRAALFELCAAEGKSRCHALVRFPDSADGPTVNLHMKRRTPGSAIPAFDSNIPSFGVVTLCFFLDGRL